MYTYQTLENTSLSQITQCFNLAFSDYALSTEMTEERMHAYLAMGGFDASLSFGAFCGDEMVGFIFNSSNIYGGEFSVYDMGTAIIPEHRGKGVFSNLFTCAEQELKNRGVKRYYLEVLQQNNSAIAIYRKCGFTVCRSFLVLSASGEVFQPHPDVRILPYTQFNQSAVAHCCGPEPSYEHSTNVIQKNPHFYNVAIIEDHGEITAFCVFSQKGGHPLQLGYMHREALSAVLKSILSQYPKVMAKNIDSENMEVVELLQSLGFCELARQYEMVKSIT